VSVTQGSPNIKFLIIRILRSYLFFYSRRLSECTETVLQTTIFRKMMLWIFTCFHFYNMKHQ